MVKRSREAAKDEGGVKAAKGKGGVKVTTHAHIRDECERENERECKGTRYRGRKVRRKVRR